MATNQGDSTSSTPYTGEDAQDALKRIIGTKKEDTTDYSTDSGENEDSVTQTPDDVLDTSIGVREGIIKSINPNAANGFYYKVYFEVTNTSVDAKLTYGLGFSYTPEGEWENDIYYVSEKVKVKLQSIKDTLQWIIIGIEEETPIIIPGSAAITRGNSQIEVNTDYATITNEDTVLKVDNEWAYIDDKKICVEPCAEGSTLTQETFLFPYSLRSLIIACPNYLYIYDLDNEEFISQIKIEDINFVSPYISPEENISVIQSQYSYLAINLNIGNGIYNKYQGYTLDKIYVFGNYPVDTNGDIFIPSHWSGKGGFWSTATSIIPDYDATELNWGSIKFLYRYEKLSEEEKFIRTLIVVYEKGVIILDHTINTHNITERDRISIEEIFGEETEETVQSAFIIKLDNIDNKYRIIFITNTKLISLIFEENVETTYPTTTQLITEQINDIENASIIESYESYDDDGTAYRTTGNLYILINNIDIYMIPTATEEETTLELNLLTSFDTEVENVISTIDSPYPRTGSYQYEYFAEFFYGISENSLYYIKTKTRDNFTNKNTGIIELEEEIISFGRNFQWSIA